MDVVADRLHAVPARPCLTEQSPRRLRQAIGFAVTTSQQELQDLVRQGLDCVLFGLRPHQVGHARIVDDPVGRDSKATLRGHDAIAPVTEHISIRADRNRRAQDCIVRSNHVRRPTIVNIQRQYDGGGLREAVNQLATNSNLHGQSFTAGANRRTTQFVVLRSASRDYLNASAASSQHR
jgi:hypothetical protein